PVGLATPPHPQGPQPPGPDPPAPRASVEVRPYSFQGLGPPPHPQGPQPPGPDPPAPRGSVTTADEEPEGMNVQAVAELLPANCVLLDEFLAPEELNALLEYTQQREMEFQISEVVSPGVECGTVDFEHRRSRVLTELDKHRDVIVHRIQCCFPRVLEQLGLEP